MAWDLEAILEYKMDEDQGKAFKLCLLWEDMAILEFPEYHHVGLRKKGDPRKSHLFRICYKLVRETKGMIPDPEYRLYILAQLHMLKHIADNVLISPNVLVGDQAWKRWKKWKFLYDRQINNSKLTVEDANPIAPFYKVISALKSTKAFLEKKFEHHPSINDIKSAMSDHSLVKWVTMQRVSPYYVLLSPWIKNILEDKNWEDVFLFDLSVYKRSITDEVKSEFNNIFDYEIDSFT